MRTLPILILFVMLITVTIVSAGNDEFYTWSIVEQCLPDPIMPDENWTFDGEILMGGWGGIHAVSAEFDTPYIVNWGYGRISPDGQWVLEQEQRSYIEHLTGGGPMARYTTRYYDIVVTNIDTNERIIFPWNATIEMTSRAYLFGSAGPIWLNNNSFASFYGYNGVYGGEVKIGHLATGQITDWQGPNFADYELSISPDQTRMISYGQIYDLADNSLIREDLVTTNYDLNFTRWNNDSTMFADVIRNSESERYALSLSVFDRDGNLLAIPYHIPNGRILLRRWSPDGNYLIFQVGDYDLNEYRTYMINMREEVIYDMCIRYHVSGWAWSSDGTQLATMVNGGQQPVLIIEMREWQAYIVAYHTGSVALWRDTE